MAQGYGGCATKTVLRNGKECDINIGDFNPETDKELKEKRPVRNPLFAILDGNKKEVFDGDVIEWTSTDGVRLVKVINYDEKDCCFCAGNMPLLRLQKQIVRLIRYSTSLRNNV